MTPFQAIYEHTVKLLPKLASRNTSAIHGWLDAGCDAAKDILPTISRLAEKNPEIGGFSYFTSAILKARDERIAVKPFEEKILLDPEGAPARKAKRAAFMVRKAMIRDPQLERWLADYESQHGRVEA